jgi:hypothetical protein
MRLAFAGRLAADRAWTASCLTHCDSRGVHEPSDPRCIAAGFADIAVSPPLPCELVMRLLSRLWNMVEGGPRASVFSFRSGIVRFFAFVGGLAIGAVGLSFLAGLIVLFGSACMVVSFAAGVVGGFSDAVRALQMRKASARTPRKELDAGLPTEETPKSEVGGLAELPVPGGLRLADGPSPSTGGDVDDRAEAREVDRAERDRFRLCLAGVPEETPKVAVPSSPRVARFKTRGSGRASPSLLSGRTACKATVARPRVAHARLRAGSSEVTLLLTIVGVCSTPATVVDVDQHGQLHDNTNGVIVHFDV